MRPLVLLLPLAAGLELICPTDEDLRRAAVPRLGVWSGDWSGYTTLDNPGGTRLSGVGIDMIAGPSEILVIADDTANPDWVALDLLSQAEHDESAQSILITTSAETGRAVADAVERHLQVLERRDIARASWRDFGAIITVPDLAQAAALSNRIAPEHLELCVADPEALLPQIRHAGAIFVGQWTPEAIGDYVGGPNHVLPTARSARVSSGLSVMDFLKRTTLAQ